MPDRGTLPGCDVCLWLCGVWETPVPAINPPKNEFSGTVGGALMAPGMTDVGDGASARPAPGCWEVGASPSDGRWGNWVGRGWADGTRLIKRDPGEGRPVQAAVAGGGGDESGPTGGQAGGLSPALSALFNVPLGRVWEEWGQGSWSSPFPGPGGGGWGSHKERFLSGGGVRGMWLIV